MRVLRREHADALLVWNSEGSGQPATEWLSGFTGTSSVLLISRGGRVLITDGRYTEQAKRQAKGFTVSIMTGQKTLMGLLSRFAHDLKLNTVLIDGTKTYFSAIEAIRKKMPKLGVVSKDRVLQELRMVKEKPELVLLKEAAAVAVRAFMRLTPLIKAGMTERAIAERLEELCRDEGAEGFAFPTSVASGKNGALPHARSTDKKIQKGELITIDFGVCYRGYVSDMTRMVGIGKLHPRLLRMHEAVRRAQELGCKKAKAGATGSEIDAACRGYLTKCGLGTYFTHSTGHGIGREVHELPIISHLSSAKLPVGAVITCEPGVYIPKVGGVRIEDSLVLTKSGSINLTEGVTKKLIIV